MWSGVAWWGYKQRQCILDETPLLGFAMHYLAHTHTFIAMEPFCSSETTAG